MSGLIFPAKCVLCGRLLEKDETDLCHKCRIDAPVCTSHQAKLPFINDWVAIWRYEGNARRSILRYKFNNRRHYVNSYGRLLAMKLIQEFPEGFDMLTWVPTGSIRKFFRGFDQVQLLAEAVGRELDMPAQPLLRKIRNNRPQSGIRSDAKRRANVLGAYISTAGCPLEGKRILLLDDIITTGSTAGECARILLTAGAKEVYCGAVASARRSKR